tara:strand:+ start:1001 stop:1279 length:279 start_codon:yes stop_codon:yes gene_type:complete
MKCEPIIAKKLQNDMIHFKTQKGLGVQLTRVTTVGHLSVQLVGQYGVPINTLNASSLGPTSLVFYIFCFAGVAENKSGGKNETAENWHYVQE